MGKGRLERIAVLCMLATVAVLAGGALPVPAQLSVPGTTVTAPSTTVTVPSTTVRVPSTATTVTTPQTKVTTPSTKVTRPSTKVTTPTVKSPAPKPPATGVKPADSVTKKVTSPPSSGADGGTVKKTVDTVSKVTGTSGGSSSVDSVGDAVGGVAGGLTGSLTRSGSGTGDAGASGLGAGPGGLTFLSGPGGGGASGGPGAFGPGAGGGSGGGSAGGGGSLAAMLAGASAKELRAVLEQLEGCLPALAGVDRRVISMRAGLSGAPLSRAQVGRRLGLSRTAGRASERRALDRLQFAAANTGCAGAVVGPFDPAGIGNLAPQLVLAGAVPVNAGGGAGTFAPVRGITGRSASPLFELGGGGGSGPAWAIILFTVLLSVSIAALTRELRHSF